MRRAPLLGSHIALALLASIAGGQSRPTLTPADYGRFETLGAATLSPDGRWIAYGISRVNDTTELRIRPVDRDTVRTVRWGSAPSFSADSRWLAWSIGVSLEEQQRLQRDRRPVRLRVGVLDLSTGEERVIDAVRARAFDASGRWLALHGYAPEEPRGKGADLRVLDLQSGTEVTFGNAAEFAWSRTGSLIAITIATGTPAGNGVQVYDARTGRLQALDGGDAAFRQLAWRERGPDLAVLRSVRPAARTGGRHVLLAWRGVDRASPERLQLDSAAAGLADTLMISEHYRPRWSDDGRRLAIGLRPAERDTAARGAGARRDTAAATRPDSTRPPADTARPRPDSASAVQDSLPGVQIWHTKDVQIIPRQQSQTQARGRRTLLAVWDPAANRVVQVGSSLDENATLAEGWRHGIERVTARYPWGTMFGRRYLDVWAVDLASGERRQVADSVRYAWDSGAGRYLLTFDGADYWTHDLRSGARRNITQGVATAFADTLYDTPTDLLPPHGTGGWMHEDRAVLLYDRHDVWRVATDGSGATRLTRGAEDSVAHRVVRVDTAGRTIDPAAPLWLSLYGEWTQQRGYAVLRRGARTPEWLVFDDRGVSGLRRADSADVFLYRAEARDVSPNWFVSGQTLAGARQVTETNPFLRDYAWTRAERIEYRNETGRRLQGILLFPANHDPSRRYPMIVYAYEILSPSMHSFQVPSERSYYNQTAWTQHGYFVLLPDIVFRARDPGVSLLETLRPAVASVVAKGLVDPARVGFVGHSWGGYHGTYVATHSNLFAASVAGAPLTDFVSFMGQIHWGPGNAETDHWETGQARMEVPYWEDPDAHVRNSPLHNVHNMTTPLLMAHGNKDGVVEFFQATTFYNFARRAGKQMVLLVYEDENHSFQKKPNQIDYHRRIVEWFGHYLKGEPAPSWITDGVPLDEHEREKRRIAGRRSGIQTADGGPP
ncbi:MAG TPA: prolyl oligopeptidase family serine peptidase [Gemmatimonadaceae bacterium]|nr:prolyl oligopeptidase family serine peptidase [Gemmatimonadaceae bacterium]